MTGSPASHIAMLRPLLALDGLSVADIGAGSGAFARDMAADGADAAAVEIDIDRLERKPSPRGSISYHRGRGEDLPFADASRDLLTFIFSFHHVPAAHQDAALAEARRVLRPSGRLHVVEPLTDGALTEVIAPLEDETETLASSRARLEDPAGFTCLHRTTYAVPYRYDSVAELIASVVGIDPDRAAPGPEIAAEIGRRFDRLARPEGGLFVFEQPCVAFHFARRDLGNPPPA